MAKNVKAVEAPAQVKKEVIANFDKAYALAESEFNKDKKKQPAFVAQHLNAGFIKALGEMADNCEKATAGYLNLLTGIAVKTVLRDKVDVRYPQVQTQNQTDKPAGFNLRGLSENEIYNWMETHSFPGAKSGWQTRTFERPKPYTLDYAENISYIKEPFLACYDYLEKNTSDCDPFYALAFLLWRRIVLRDSSNIKLSKPNVKDVLQITDIFNQHFFYDYHDKKGASRLPVLALTAMYEVLLEELDRYKGKKLNPLESHSAADSQTGAVGDIEIVNPDGTVFEGVEVKHNIVISEAIMDSVKQKISGNRIDRYYVLTTHSHHDPSQAIQDKAAEITKLLGCQVIVNGVLPTCHRPHRQSI